MGEESLGHMIKRRRETLGFSQARLGELVGRSVSTIRNWERDKSTPSLPSDAVALAAVLGLSESRVVEAAGFDRGDVESRPTLEQGYASLAPSGPSPAPEPADVEPTPSEQPGEPERPAGGPTGPVEAEAETAPAAGEAEPPEPEEYTPAEREAVEPGPVWPDPAANVPGEPGAGAEAASPAPPAAEEETAAAEPDDVEIERFSLPEPVAPSSAVFETPSRRLQAVSEDSARADESSAPEPSVSRAAPPTVLESPPPAEPSYLEDPDERQRYRARALATAAVVVFLLIVFLWSFDRTVDALGSMWDDFTGMLEL